MFHMIETSKAKHQSSFISEIVRKELNDLRPYTENIFTPRCYIFRNANKQTSL